MALTINHNLMAMNTARNLGTAYGGMATSVQRLSSGLRVGTAADDAAGLAIRELMRADIKAINQGIRNANDAISMIQVADGALGVIDEKLIRMKELAMQASTGTYSSDQRLMIDDEFQAMKSEIYRIANATECNGVKLLDGSLSGMHDGTGVQSQGELKVHFGTGNCASEDYYSVQIPQVQDEQVNLGGEIENGPDDPGASFAIDWWMYQDTGSPNIDVALLNPLGVTENAQDFEVFYNVSSARMEEGFESSPLILRAHGNVQYDFKNFEIAFNASAVGNKWTIVNGVIGSSITTGANAGFTEARITLPDGTLVNGIFNLGVPATNTTVRFDLSSGADIYDHSGNYPGATITSSTGSQINVSLDGSGAPDISVSISGASPLRNAFTKFDLHSNFELRAGKLGLQNLNVRTQESAQDTLVNLNESILAKDKVRANLGAMQNRLENTITNLSIQAENLQASESRISDADVSQEMTEFVREQILAQSATAMLAQANSFPKMALQLIQG